MSLVRARRAQGEANTLENRPGKSRKLTMSLSQFSDHVMLVTARGGSKGVPGKNIRLLGGKPLIMWTIEAALSSKSKCDVFVSTDDPQIAKIAESSGAMVPFLRPEELATDEASHIDVVRHFLGELKILNRSPAYVVLLQPTSPFRSTRDIDAALDCAYSSKARAVVSFTYPKHHAGKQFRIDEARNIQPLIPKKSVSTRRQDFDTYLAENGAIYVFQPALIETGDTFIPHDTVPYLMPPSRSLDIDDEWDFTVAELIAAGVKDPSIGN